VYSLYRVDYGSFVDWKIYEDLIRTSEDWQKTGKPRYDDVILRNHDGTASFATCFRLYSGMVRGQKLEFGVFQPFETKKRHQLTGMVFAKKLKTLEFRILDDIVRSCYIQPDPTKPNFFHVNDLAEPDLYLRLRRM
jgi:hypothetical protein